jgi:hypothetical protein
MSELAPFTRTYQEALYVIESDTARTLLQENAKLWYSVKKLNIESVTKGTAMSLPKGLQTQLALACHAIVMENFAMFHNPNMAGATFGWACFPELMRSRCQSGVFLNTVIPEKHASAAREFAAGLGYQLALRMVELMTQDYE